MSKTAGGGGRVSVGRVMGGKPAKILTASRAGRNPMRKNK